MDKTRVWLEKRIDEGSYLLGTIRAACHQRVLRGESTLLFFYPSPRTPIRCTMTTLWFEEPITIHRIIEFIVV